MAKPISRKSRTVPIAVLVVVTFVSLIFLPRLVHNGLYLEVGSSPGNTSKDVPDTAKSSPLDASPFQKSSRPPEQKGEGVSDEPGDKSESSKLASEEETSGIDDPDEVAEERKAEQETDSSTRSESQPSDGSEKVGPTCFFYDRPPRTGSTTIGRALRECLEGRGYRQPKGGMRDKRPYHIANMLKLTNDRIGVFGRHLYINASDVAAMRRKCGRLLYVTSCKPMRERKWSIAKYRLVTGSHAVLSEELKNKAMEMLKRDSNAENFLEHYPYFNEKVEPLNLRPEEKLVPDYVVRSDLFAEDLGKLLSALHCGAQFQSHNTHTAEVKSTAFLDKLQLKMGDATYHRLSKIAEERNEDGLRKARTF